VYDRFLLLLVLSCLLSPLGIWCHHMLHMNTTHCAWYVSFTTAIVMSSLSFRYLVSPYVGHEHDTLCMIGFFYHWYCHVVSLLLVFGITICCTRTWHSVYDRFFFLLVLSCRLSSLGSWYHHLLHTNMTHCVWYVSFTTSIVMSSLSFRYLVSPYVAQEHDTLCMICFFYYWYCHVVSLL
jgi:hypothetical protein